MGIIKKTLLGIFLLILSGPIYANCQGEGNVSLAFDNIEIRSAIQLLSDFGGLKVVIAKNIEGSHPIFFTCQNWAEAIKQIVILNNLSIKIIDKVLYVNKP